MTTLQLIQLLQSFPPSTKVVVRGYENGYNDILKLIEIKIKPNAESAWYNGEYEESKEADAIYAVNLFGENQNS